MSQSRIDARSDTAVEVVGEIHARLAAAGHDVPVRLWDGDTLGPADAPWRLVLRHPWSLRALLVPFSDLNAGEAFLDDDVDVEGSMVATMRALAALRADGIDRPGKLGMMRSLLRLPSPPTGKRRRHAHAAGRVRPRGRAHSLRRDAQVVRHHYDVGNDFYRLFLDERLVYSCGVFAEEERAEGVTDRDTLDRAQWRKLELICRKLDLRSGERLLDVGCGWGALVLHAARHHGVNALGITLSPEQAEAARARVEQAGLTDRVRIEVQDYREVDGRFDAIASVGMVEHVGADQLPRYARHLAELLTPGGRLLNHGITTGGREVVRDFSRDRDSFVARYVFPDGALVPAHVTASEIERAGLELWDVQQLRPQLCAHARALGRQPRGPGRRRSCPG